jgi:hypothetical protein
VITSPSTSSVTAVIVLLGKLDQIRGERFSTIKKASTRTRVGEFQPIAIT